VKKTVVSWRHKNNYKHEEQKYGIIHRVILWYRVSIPIRLRLLRGGGHSSSSPSTRNKFWNQWHGSINSYILFQNILIKSWRFDVIWRLLQNCEWVNSLAGRIVDSFCSEENVSFKLQKGLNYYLTIYTRKNSITVSVTLCKLVYLVWATNYLDVLFSKSCCQLSRSHFPQKQTDDRQTDRQSRRLLLFL